MLINTSVLNAVFLSLRTDFNKAFQAAPTKWGRIAMRVPSGSAQNDYKWLSSFPRMRRWIGDKHVKSLAAFSYTIVNDDWEATIEVDRNHIADDTLGIYAPQAQMAGFAAAQLPDEIVFALVAAGATNSCYDGQPFFATDHPVGTSTASNKDNNPLQADTLAHAQASYGAARSAMQAYVDDEGRSLGVMPDVLLVPPALEDTARILMTAERFGDNPNPYRNTAEVVVSPWLTDPDAWYLLDCTKPVRPFIYQERTAPTFVQQTGMDNDAVFNRRAYKYGAEARAAGGYAFWQLAYANIP
ncbi:MAG: Mu-like prophage major head subunit gpT family protein [Candidatus Contendobacter sp.]|nr:Mu-like prophage major head subunit gpT family protein [Candidatus Contendobacter sp.]